MKKNVVKFFVSMVLVALAVIGIGNAKPAMAKEIEIKSSDYGYGKYVITATATGYDGVQDEDSVVFYHLPIDATYEINPVTGAYEIEITSAGADVRSVSAYLDGEYIGSLSSKDFENGRIPFSMAGKPTGTYTITIYATNSKGEVIDAPFTITIHYTATEVPDAGAPDTGGFFRSLNISREDYLTTGLIMFFVLGIVALGIVMGGKRNNKKRH